MTHILYQVYQRTLASWLDKWQTRQSRRLAPELLDTALMLLQLNLDPLTQLLDDLYSPHPRGRPPFDPLVMMRALILMTLLRQTRIDQFANDLRTQPRLAHMAGFEPDQTPAASTFYLFIDRLENGPFQPKCPHRVLPAEVRHGKHRRNLHQERAAKEAQRQHILDQCDSITQQLKDELLEGQDQDRPRDLLQRLEDILFQCAVIPSAERGLLGDPQAWLLGGDGSALPSGASPYGKPTCQCRGQGIFNCHCDRFYSDPTADWGWDSYRDGYSFGHTFYQHLISSSGHDLPVHVLIAQASESDFTLSLKSLDRLIKTACENQFDMRIEAAAYDVGHDGQGVYEYLRAKHIKPVIALNPRTNPPVNPKGTAKQCNAQGIPLCPGGLPMRRHGATSPHRLMFNCPVKRPTHKGGQTQWNVFMEECPNPVLCDPHSKMGPVVYVRSDQDPRYYPPIPRGSQRFEAIMNLRSGCERSNGVKKVVHHLGARPCRSATHFVVRLYLVSLVEHLKAWLAEDRKRLGADWRRWCEPLMQATS